VSRSSADISDLARRYLEGIGRLGERNLVLDLPREQAIRMAGGIHAGVGGPGDGARHRGEPPAQADARTGASSGADTRPGGWATSAPSYPEEELNRLASVGEADEIGATPDLATLRAIVERCSRCLLHETRTKPVFGEGDDAARVVCVGEAPGAVEDETGRPFVGRAGKLLDRLLMTIGLPRESVFICNVLKSRPPNNRDPLPEEVQACSPFLQRQLELINPEVIVAFGAFAARTLLESKAALGKMRGTIHRYAGYPVVVTYHPAALLRNPGWTRATWEDLQRVRRILDGDADGISAPAVSSARPDDVQPRDPVQPEIFG
jgi:DNA polymerase